jgi:hypothetical protein
MDFAGRWADSSKKLFFLFLFAGITACGGGGEGGSSASPPVGSSPPPPPASSPPPQDPGEEIVEIDVTGSVGDGPIVGAELSAYNKYDSLLLSYTSDEQASYSIKIKEKGKNYPVRFHAARGRDLVTGTGADFLLVSALLRPQKGSRGNINPHSSLMIGISERLGPLNDVNYYKGRDIVMSALSFGLDRSQIDDPIAAEVDDITLPILVKASESLGEMIRRTRDALIGYGVTSAQEVVNALAADLVDGVLDGRGAIGSDPRIAAVANVVSAQVLSEGLVNELKVGGAVSTTLMDYSIKVVRPNAAATATTDNVAISREMLTQTEKSLRATWALTRDPALDDLYWTVRAIDDGVKPAEIRGTLPDAEAELATAVETVALGSTDDLEVVNSTMRTGVVPDAPADPEVGFAVLEQQVVEGGQLLVLVERANPSGSAWVDFDYLAGSATAGEDFGSAAGRLNFADGEAARYIEVTTVQDQLVEGSESFQIQLVGVSSESYLNSNTVATVTINDDDEEVAPSEVGFVTLGHQVPEGEQVMVLVQRADSAGSAWVNFEYVAGSAQPGMDYADNSGRLDFADGETAKYINVTSLQDGSVEGVETFELHLTETSANVYLNMNSIATVTINDDDQAAPPPEPEPILGSATLSWTAPVEREDGSVLDNLAGYKVRYGTSQNDLGTVDVLDNPGIVTYVVENLEQGTWYFAVIAFDADGRESEFSNIASKEIM